MELPKPVDFEKGGETKPTEFVDLEKGQDIDGCETKQGETDTKNQILANVLSKISMVIILAVYIVLVIICFKGMSSVWAAVGTTIFITPSYILMLKTIPYLRDVSMERFASHPAAGRDGSNLQSGNV
ncbi:hypothetical protein [Oryza sativa Japonica Group]|uniref:Os01g0726950 protein n=3 Tax=Oryza TaxID=4527 RepID=Q5JM53_ORYSJ|nr:uncharacterized protein LOC107275859 [Oryza sativa Japonica Group]KAF2952096.1 hypothetical protein DAI22_01g310300 [Oryza sativa Japonica Group]BAD87454.1 hypothetical protein [Oryza sativa Japonica Group]BAS74131.1 Os01g0726950 [Oryza sativa Japonica Group]